MTQKALILGATGRFGHHMKLALAATGWETTTFDRKSDTLSEAAADVDIIVYGWNPQYPDWKEQAEALLDKAIDVAQDTGATLLFPGNVYPYGAQKNARWSENTPFTAENELGMIRNRMEKRLKNSKVKSIVLRAGDFIDTRKSGNWFDEIITKRLATSGKITYPGNPEIPHAWTYLPDYTRAFAELASKRKSLPDFVSINFPGYTLTGNNIAQHLNAKLSRMFWLPIVLARPFWPIAKHLLEMRYLWDTPHQLESTEFDRLLPDFRSTPMSDALRAAVSFQINPDQPVVGTRAAV